MISQNVFLILKKEVPGDLKLYLFKESATYNNVLLLTILIQRKVNRYLRDNYMCFAGKNELIDADNSLQKWLNLSVCVFPCCTNI